ncbi:MAG: Nudix family hydrolase [Pseudomonadota bacterium]|nr:Nudix family hydrolase [Pseudomonadota bacterium]
MLSIEADRDREREDSGASSETERNAREIKVVAAAVVNDAGEVLIARRPKHVHQGDKWEFPGGKIEPGESAVTALRRELLEELGIKAQVFEPLIQVRYRYPEKAVDLNVWKVTRYKGECRGCEGQPFAWVAPSKLPQFDFPAANRPILKALALPDRYLITPAPAGDDVAFLNRLERALQRGISLVQLRAPVHRYCELARRARDLCHEHGARMLINAGPEWVEGLAVDGVHLNGARLKVSPVRPLSRSYLIAASCHDQEEIARANAIGADFVVISAIQPTLSHPGARPLGWRAFRQLCDRADMPVYALGGMCVADVAQAKRCGAQGIAAIRALWSS